jgi:hypothetical protein
MAATTGLGLTLDPMGKMFQNASSLKPLGQLKPNCPGMIIGRQVMAIVHLDQKFTCTFGPGELKRTNNNLQNIYRLFYKIM